MDRQAARQHPRPLRRPVWRAAEEQAQQWRGLRHLCALLRAPDQRPRGPERQRLVGARHETHPSLQHRQRERRRVCSRDTPSTETAEPPVRHIRRFDARPHARHLAAEHSRTKPPACRKGGARREAVEKEQEEVCGVNVRACVVRRRSVREAEGQGLGEKEQSVGRLWCGRGGPVRGAGLLAIRPQRRCIGRRGPGRNQPRIMGQQNGQRPVRAQRS